MDLLNLRSAQADRHRAEEKAQQFFESLFGGRIDRASAMVGNHFTWFGVIDVDWGGDAIRAFVEETETTVSNPRSIKTTMIDMVPEARRTEIFGDLGNDDRVALIDLARRDRTFTVTVVVNVRRGTIVSVFDATPFRNALNALVRSAEGA